MVRLFIEDTYYVNESAIYDRREVELADTIDYTINKQFTDVSSPNDIQNDWTKQISIPRTRNNEKIFGDLYNPNRSVVSSSGKSHFGLYFDPYRKFNFRLMNNDDTIMVGYGKVINCTQDAINVNLNGEMGRIMQELKKLTFNPTEYTEKSDKKYYISTDKYVKDIINRDFIYADFENNKSYVDLFDRNGNVCNIHNIIGFLPNNAYMDGFNYKDIELKDGNGNRFSKSFSDILDGLSDYAEKTGVDGDTTLPDGITPRGIGDYRSYLQQPYIFYNKLFQIVEEECKNIPILQDYKWEYDPKWFNGDNPYWSKLCMLLNPIGLSKGIKDEVSKPYTMGLNIFKLDESKSTRGYATDPTQEQFMILNNYQGDDTTTYLVSGTVQFIMTINTTEYLETLHMRYYNSSTSNNYATLHLYAAAYDFNTNTELDRIDYTVTPKESNIAPKEDEYNKKFTTLDLFNTYKNFTYSFPFMFKFPPQPNGNIAIKFGAYFSEKTPFQCEEVTYCYPQIKIGIKTPYCTYTKFINSSQSGSQFNLEGMWDMNIKPFDKILEYCKMFKILPCKVDGLEKKIKFIPQDRFFANNKIVDWTNKVDYSKGFTVSPNFADTKYLTFGYGENKTKYGEIYKKNNSVEYGALKVNTNYQFNTEEKTEFGEIPSTIDCSENILSWCDLYDNRQIIYRMPQETTIALSDNDNKYKNNFGGLFFYCGTQPIDSREPYRTCYVSDDTTNMFRNQVFMYNGVDSDKTLSSFPKASTSYECYTSTFTIPMENYTYESARFDNTEGIYNLIWDRYMNDIYSVQNKKIECYVLLDIPDFQNFDFNHFVKIDNQLYLVNKIIDYNPTDLQPTKCELFSIYNLNNYTTNRFNYLRFIGRFNVITLSSSLGSKTGTQSFSSYRNYCYAALRETKSTKVTFSGVQLTTTPQKIALPSTGILNYSVTNMTSGDALNVIYYADENGKLPMEYTNFIIR